MKVIWQLVKPTPRQAESRVRCTWNRCPLFNQNPCVCAADIQNCLHYALMHYQKKVKILNDETKHEKSS